MKRIYLLLHSLYPTVNAFSLAMFSYAISGIEALRINGQSTGEVK
ncbi:hypothetical protein DFP76_103302 [Marinomonas aquiplantarum]|uniref:Uncharacterized protein n=1 Tax=Marinomonas aquiplantarum TaxID=491951 RepID=A0A366D412_9GAMM|nr:hypothetical protein DFP76_103302 [Marinomonas aquiplantarum]